KAILSGADNRPPMLEKDMYDFCKSRMELYMLNRQHDRMILESVEQAPQIDYAPMVQHSSEYSPPETGLVVLVFQKGDDHIDAINHMMSFLTAVVTLRVTIQPIQGMQNFMSAGSSRPFTLGSGGAPGKHRVIVCYNCKGEGHMSKQCTKHKRKQDAEWFKDKVLLVQAQANGQEWQSHQAIKMSLKQMLPIKRMT
nr:hypothetical protein [Tanacetum cinerariifolium]